MKKYLIIFITVFLVFFIVKGIYEQLSKQDVPGKAKRTPCMAKVTSFERSYGNEAIKNLKKQIKMGDFKIRSSIDKAVFMESTLFNTIDMEKLDKIMIETLKSYSNGKINPASKNTVEYKVYENDKDDPKKKSDSCKLFRGYVVMKFIDGNNKTVYQNQIDFMDHKGKDIPETISCGVSAFMTY